MKERLIGFEVSSAEIQYAILTLEDETFQFETSKTLHLQSGDRPKGYHVIFQQLVALVTEEKVGCACIKASALSRAGMKKAHLEAAELRGVVQAACASACKVKLVSKASVSRNFGDRNTDAYLKDDSFWEECGLSGLPKGKREAALAVITQHSNKAGR